MIPGLNYDHYLYMLTLSHGGPCDFPETVQRHCQLRKWVARGTLTDDGRHVLARASADPPAKPFRDLDALPTGRRPIPR